MHVPKLITGFALLCARGLENRLKNCLKRTKCYISSLENVNC